MGIGMGGKVAVSCVVGPAVMNRGGGGLILLLRQGIGPGLRQCVSIKSSSICTSTSSSISSSASSPFYYHYHHPLSLSISMNNNNNNNINRRRKRSLMSFRAHSSFSHHDVNDSGSIDSPLISSMHSKIKEQLKAESVTVKDAYGDGRHVSIDVISSVFEGESAVSRQRMVYKAIWEELQNTVHAVDQMTTKTPSEAAATNK